MINQMQPELLGWMQPQIRQKILLSQAVLDHYSFSEVQYVEFRVGKIKQFQFANIRLKEYLGYAIYPSPADQLYPMPFIFVKLEIHSKKILDLIIQVLKNLLQNAIRGIQKIYDLRVKRQPFQKFIALTAKCEEYRMNLQDILTFCHKNKNQNSSSDYVKLIKYFRSNIILIYKRILLRARKNKNASVKDIMIDRYYHVIVGNTIFAKGQFQPNTKIGEKGQKYIKGSMRQDISRTLTELFSLSSTSEDLLADISIKILSEKKQWVEIEQEIKQLSYIQNIIGKNADLKELPNQQMLKQLVQIEKSLAKNQPQPHMINLKKFHIEQQARDASYMIGEQK